MDGVAPEIVWGLLTRGIGLVYFISFASLTAQVLPAAGSNGITPLAPRLARIRRDFPGPLKYLYFPTLLWLSDGDRALRALPWAGLIAAASVIAGGPHTFWGLLACYLIYLSLDRAMILIYPWDCMLFEAGFFALFLPPLHVLPDITAVGAPDPALAWVYRLLLFRVIFGFGKFKFLGSTRRDLGYLKGFLVNQPLPSPLGWLGQKLPLWMLKAAMLVMFVVEIPLPFTVFVPGIWSIAGAAGIGLLMIGIWASGTFGYFNLVMLVVALSWLDTETARAFSFSELFSAGGNAPLHALVVLHTLGAVLSFPFNSFCANSWLLWSFWLRVRPRFLTWPIALFRFLHPLRWLHAYGVFPPHSVPGVKMVPVMEVSWDGREWHALEHKFSPTQEESPPRFCAPHHARLDQALIYEGFGLNDASVMRNFVGWWEPYGHGRVTGATLLMQRVLEGKVPTTVFYSKDLERERGVPRLARVRTYMLEPESLEELRRTGRWWRRTLVGPHWPAMERQEGFWDNLIPPPELWHFDDLVWLRRSFMGKLMKRARAGEDPHALVLERAEDIGPEDVERFWTELVLALKTDDRHQWRELRGTVQELRRRHDRQQLYRFERLAGRYGALLFAKLEPLFLDAGIKPVFGLAEATIDVKTYYHLGLLARHIVCEGREAYEAVMQRPELAKEHLARMTMRSGTYLDVLFRYEVFVFQAQKLRLVARYMEHEGRPALTEKQEEQRRRIDAIAQRVFGAVDMVELLKTELEGNEHVLDVPERWPRFVIQSDGLVRRLPFEDEAAPPEAARALAG